MTSPLRGPRAQKEAASPPLIFRCAAPGTERPSGPKGAAHRAARAALRLPLTPETTAAPGTRKSGQAQACPRDARGAQTPRRTGMRKHPDPEGNDELAFDTQKDGK